MLLKNESEMQELLFPRGYLMTNDDDVDAESHPFYGNWNNFALQGYKFLVHPKQRFESVIQDNFGMALVGHAFNPVVEDHNVTETELLKEAMALFKKSEKEFLEFFNQWTGLFNLFVFTENKVSLYGDAAGMYMAFYGTSNGKQYCSSHTKLLGDICGLEFDDYVTRLINYKFYSLFGKTLPGDLSPYKQFKRLIPNHCAILEDEKWSVQRFFPSDNDMGLFDMPYEKLIDKAAGILSNSMKIIPQKWNSPAISLTGGCDSKTTLSCTAGNYDKYDYFSYISSDSEAVDAEAASEICKLLGLKHEIYEIPDNNDADYIAKLSEIMEYNSGCIGKSNENDVRKRAFFLNRSNFDVEVKSWVSEVGRAYYHKRFSKKTFPEKLTPRYARTLYKVFLTDHKLIRETDKIFEEYINKYCSDKSFDKIPWYDLFFWEFRVGSWNGLVITGEQQIAYDITIPYNNRVLLQCFLSTPVEKRIKDIPHWDIMRKMNSAIADCGISVVNVKHTERRAKIERLYLEVLSRISF